MDFCCFLLFCVGVTNCGKSIKLKLICLEKKIVYFFLWLNDVQELCYIKIFMATILRISNNNEYTNVIKYTFNWRVHCSSEKRIIFTWFIFIIALKWMKAIQIIAWISILKLVFSILLPFISYTIDIQIWSMKQWGVLKNVSEIHDNHYIAWSSNKTLILYSRRSLKHKNSSLLEMLSVVSVKS